MAKRTRVPRASLACTMLDDPDLIALLQDSSGIQGFSVFCLLLMAAKVQGNDGIFEHPNAVIAAMLRLPVASFEDGLATLSERTDWIIADVNRVVVRSYKKWNSWGGSREGAGCKVEESSRNQDGIKMESSRNQDGIKSESKVDVPVSVSASVSGLTTNSASKPPTGRKRPRKPHWSDPAGSKLSTLVGCPKRGPWAFLNKLAFDHTQGAVLDALSRAPEFTNWKHAAGWLTKAAKGIHATTPVTDDYEDRLD